MGLGQWAWAVFLFPCVKPEAKRTQRRHYTFFSILTFGFLQQELGKISCAWTPLGFFFWFFWVIWSLILWSSSSPTLSISFIFIFFGDGGLFSLLRTNHGITPERRPQHSTFCCGFVSCGAARTDPSPNLWWCLDCGVWNAAVWKQNKQWPKYAWHTELVVWQTSPANQT